MTTTTCDQAVVKRARSGLAVVALALAVAGCTAAAPSPKQPDGASIGGVDWQGARIQLPAGSGMNCPTGLKQLTPADTPGGKVAWVKGDGTANNFVVDVTATATGDLTSDGSYETVLKVRCTSLEPSYEQDPDMPGQLLIVRIIDAGNLVGLAYVGPAYARFPQSHVVSGQLRTQVWYESEGSNSVYALGHMRSYQWNGNTFVQVSGRTSPLVLVPVKAGNGSPVILPAIRDGQTLACAAAKLVFSGGEAHTAEANFTVSGSAQLVDLDGDGNQELLAEIVCTVAGVARTSLYLLRQEPERLAAIDVPVANPGTLQIDNGWKLTGTDLTITVMNIRSGEKKKHVMQWDGTTFQGKIGNIG